MFVLHNPAWVDPIGEGRYETVDEAVAALRAHCALHHEDPVQQQTVVAELVPVRRVTYQITDIERAA